MYFKIQKSSLQYFIYKIQLKKMKEGKYSVKAGRFIFDPQTKKVKVSKDKGMLSIYSNEEGQNYVSWVNLETNMEQIYIMVFPFDAIFEKIASQNNTFLLKFESNQDRYFFYLQEKINPEQFVNKFNEKIAFVKEYSEEMQEEKIEEKEQKMQVQIPAEKAPIVQQQKKHKDLFSPDFLKRLQANLQASKGNQGQGITHLSKVVTPQAISFLLNELTPQQKQAFVQFLPPEQNSPHDIASNIRSPQFQQSLDVLSDALNSENAIPLFMQLGLDQKHLRTNYGVHAFLKALQQWSQKQKK